MTDKRFRLNTEDIGHIYIDNPNGEHMSWIEVEETLNGLTTRCSRLEKENEQLLEFKKRYDELLVDYNNLACRFDELNEENEKLKKVMNELKDMLQIDIDTGVRSYPLQLSEYLVSALDKIGDVE